MKFEWRGGDSLGLHEDVGIGGIQHKFADELLRDGDGRLVGHAQIGEIIQESARCGEKGSSKRFKAVHGEYQSLSMVLVNKLLQQPW